METKTHILTRANGWLKNHARQHAHDIGTLALAAVMAVSMTTVMLEQRDTTASVTNLQLRKPFQTVVYISPDDVPVSHSSDLSRVVILRSSSSSASSLTLRLIEEAHEAATDSEDSSSSSSVSSVPLESLSSSSSFPALTHTQYPVSKTPNWGAMRGPAKWNRSYGEMSEDDFVPIPSYNLTVLTTPMKSLTKPIKEKNIPTITAKLFYSTRYFGKYDLDAGEFSGLHAGIDMKLARGTPIGAIAGGRVAVVEKSQVLGLHVIIEHRLQNGETYYSIYGHFDTAIVVEGQDVIPGQQVGLVGMTGNTSAPHLHLQLDRGQPGERHVPYMGGVSDQVAHPLMFIGKWEDGEN